LGLGVEGGREGELRRKEGQFLKTIGNTYANEKEGIFIL